MRHVISKPFFVVSFELFTAMILQSSTPITMLVGSFVESGFVSGLVGPIAVCGGELGSALVVKILFYDLTTILVPLCFLISTCIFMTTEKRDWRQIGCIIISISLFILSLQMISTATKALRDSASSPSILLAIFQPILFPFFIGRNTNLPLAFIGCRNHFAGQFC